MNDNLVNFHTPKLDSFLHEFSSKLYKKRTVILHAEEYHDSIFFIKQGFVKVYRISDKGEELTLAILKSGDFFPVNCGINNLPNDYYLEAVTTLEVIKVPKNQLLDFLQKNPDIFYELTRQILSRFGSLLTRMEYLILGNAYNKIATMVLMCAKRFGEIEGNTIVVKVPLTQKDIGTLAGVTRETTCVEMKKLEKKGLVDYKGRMLVVKNIKALENEALLGNTTELFLNNCL